MSKKDNKRKFLDKLGEIERAQKEIQKEKKKLVVECAHQNEKGKLKIEPINDKGMYKCKYCGATFNMNSLSRNEIEGSVRTLHDAIQQIRCFSNPHDDEKLIRILGELDFNLQESAELYDRIVNMYGKNKNKNNKDKFNKKDRDDFGSYGMGTISFIGGKKR